MIAWLVGKFSELEENIKSYLESKVNIDELTGLKNHRYFHEILNDTSENINEFEIISLIYGALNNLKDYNDILGHTIGDELLKRVEELIGQEVSEDCTAARYGGDEFTISFERYEQVL